MSKRNITLKRHRFQETENCSQGRKKNKQTTHSMARCLQLQQQLIYHQASIAGEMNHKHFYWMKNYPQYATEKKISFK